MPILNFTIQSQSALNLCWAAVASSISKYYDRNSKFSQCYIAEYVLCRTDCCTNLNACNIPADLTAALKFTGNFKKPPVNSTISFDEIKNQITNGYLIALRIGWRPDVPTKSNFLSKGHFIVINGFDNNNKIYVQDPWPSKNPNGLSLIDLAAFYKDVGQITHYFLTKKPLER